MSRLTSAGVTGVSIIRIEPQEPARLSLAEQVLTLDSTFAAENGRRMNCNANPPKYPPPKMRPLPVMTLVRSEEMVKIFPEE